jgi:putative ABC transport system permease protein
MFKNYLAVALRNLRLRKGYAVLNIAGLAVGMVSFFLISLFVQDELSYDQFHSNSDRIYRLVTTGNTNNGPVETAFSAALWGPDLEAEIPEIERAVRIKPPQQMWMVNYENQQFYEKGFIFADSTVFDVFDFNLTQGIESEVLAIPFTVVVSESIAQRYFGSEDPIGQTINLDSAYDFVVTGVMENYPEQSHMNADFLASMSTLRTPIYGQNFLTTPNNPQLYTYLLLSEGSDIRSVSAKINAYYDRRVDPLTANIGVTMEPVLQPLTDIHLKSNLDAEIQANGSMTTVLTLSAIALFILLIACINYMNLATARSASRAREVGMRKVLGAERGQLIGQFLGESMVLATLSVLVAVGLLFAFLPAFNNLASKDLAIMSFGLGRSVLVFTGIVLVCGVLAGSYPALFLSGFRPAIVLKGASSKTTGSNVLRRGLVIFQFATSIILIAATVVVYKQLAYTQDKNLGFDQENVLVVQLTDPIIRGQYQVLRSRVESLASVKSVSASQSGPGYLSQYQPVQKVGTTSDEQTLSLSYLSDFDYVETLGIDLVAGRTHSKDHPADSLGAFILNQEAVSLMGFESPDEVIGENIVMFGGLVGPVIGVVRDYHTKSLHQQIEPTVITVINQQAFFYLFVRTQAQQTEEAIADVGRIWKEIYPDYLYEYSFLDQDLNQLYATDLQLGRLFGGFALLTILIACLGLFGLASFSAEQRTKEIGVRKVMGASVSTLMLMLIRDFAIYIAIAFVIAAPLAYIGMNRWLDTFAYATSFGIGTLLMVGLLALSISVITVSWQTYKAATSDPVHSLRSE